MVYNIGAPRPNWQRSGQKLLVRLQQVLLPSRCLACDSPCARHNLDLDWRADVAGDLCATCSAQLPVNMHACRICALPLPGASSGLICGRCLRRPPPFQIGWCAYEYAYPIPHLVRRFKYGGALAHARVLGELLAKFLLENHDGPWPDCFIPVPLHALRYRERGYNQTIELGRWLERRLGIPMRSDLVIRRRHTIEQAGLSRRARRKNLRHAFAVQDVTLPEHVALLDDVITTGSTMHELAKLLARQGVKHIEAWGLARATNKLKNS